MTIRWQLVEANTVVLLGLLYLDTVDSGVQLHATDYNWGKSVGRGVVTNVGVLKLDIEL